ncbi:MAG: right-handed parallel beta-helix repeat-containing protein [Candidatus Thermoplasmatota archaeon]|nr:right-handed parallel beta-helix repeat-containing protein [Candidatus Thermoplasmatota archaeon]
MSAKGVWVAYLALGLLVAGLVVSAQQNIWNQNEKNIVKVSGDETIDSAITWFNLTKIMDGNLTITSTGKLTLRNVTLIMNCTYNGEYRIEVLSGGELYIYDNDNNKTTTEDASAITAYDMSYHYLFWVRAGAKFELKNSELHGCGYEYYTPTYDYHGLWINANNTTIEGNLISNNYDGIRFYHSNNHIIMSNNISSNQKDGICLTGSSNTVISHNDFLNNGIYSINIQSGMNNNFTISGNYISSGYLSAELLTNSSISHNTIHNGSIILSVSPSYTTIGHNTIDNSGTHDNGVELIGASNCTISNNTISSAGYSIYLDGANYHNLIANNTIWNDECGIILEYSHSNRLIDNQMSSSIYGGITLSSSNNNLIFNCSMINNFYNGIIFSHSNNNIIDSCNISDNGYNGTRVDFSKNNVIINSTICGNYSNLSYRDIYLWGDSILSLVNTTFNSSSVFIISPLAILNVSWYLNVKVIDTDAKPIHYANVAVRDNHSKLVGNFATDKGGWAKYIPCMAYSENITGRDYSMNNHSIVVGNNTQSHNMSENQEIVMPVSYFSIASPVPTALSYENYLIVQENNLTITENGTLTLSNITLKMNCGCNGSLAIEVLSGGEMYILNNSNITSTNSNNHYLFWVRNDSKFEMRDSELSACGYWGEENKDLGLFIEADDSIISNCSISNCYHGIILNGSSNNKVTNSSIHTNFRYGLYLRFSSNNKVVNCNISNNYWGIHLYYSSDNIILNSTYYNNSWCGVYVFYSSNDKIVNCSFYDHTFALDTCSLAVDHSNTEIINCTLVRGREGLVIRDYSNKVLVRNSKMLNNHRAIYLSLSSNITIEGSIISNNTFGIYLEHSGHNLISSCIIQNNTGAIFLSGSIDNTIIDCLIDSSPGKGICMWSQSKNNTVEDCPIINNTYGVYLDMGSTSTIKNSTISNGGTSEIYLNHSSVLHSINTTFITAAVGINSTLNVSWYLHINVLWNNSVPAEEANVSVQDFNCTFDMINRITDLFGWVKDIVVQEYTQNQTNTTYFIPYNVNASQGAFWNSTSIPITNTLELILYLNQPFPHNAPEISDISPDLKYTITEGVRVEFKLNVFHQNNLTLTYYWYFGDVEVKNNTLENTNITQELNWSKYFDYLSGSEIGTEYKIKIKISDSNATVSRTWKVIVINIDAPPEITSYEPKWYTMSITEEQIITFTVVVFEADCDAISYWWYVYYENVTEWVKTYGGVNATGTQSFGPFDAAGNYTVLVNVSSYNATLNESLTVTHNWLLRVWNVTDLSQQLANLQQQINTMNDTITNLTSNLTQLNANISSLQDQVDTLNGTVSNLSAQISDLNTQLCDAMRRRNESIAAEDEAKRIAAEALKAMHEAQYRLAAGVIGGVLAGIFAGAFVLALSTRRKKK